MRRSSAQLSLQLALAGPLIMPPAADAAGAAPVSLNCSFGCDVPA